jgi:hypothetical protein
MRVSQTAVDGHGIATYNHTIAVYDTSDVSASDTVFLTVLSITST